MITLPSMEYVEHGDYVVGTSTDDTFDGDFILVVYHKDRPQWLQYLRTPEPLGDAEVVRWIPRLIENLEAEHARTGH